MRHEPEFLLDCLLLRLKSTSTYEHLRSSGILPLPDKSTLRRLLSTTKPTFGFHDFALNSIADNLQNLPPSERYGAICFDEMKISTDVTFDSQSLKFEGFVDYGEGVDISDHEQQFADHVLLFSFRPYRSKWIQPIGVFATKGAAPGEMLHNLLMRAITALYEHGTIVKSVVCDGAQTNKQLTALCGISGKIEEGAQNAFPHPLEDDELIFWFFYMPHLIKCTRNHF